MIGNYTNYLVNNDDSYTMGAFNCYKIRPVKYKAC